MRIALLGYGKMGQVIEAIALQRGHTIVLKVSSDTKNYELSNVDIAIDFSTPESAVENITQCFNNNVPVICGTTGWLKDYDAMLQLCKDTNGAFIYASNFSLGVNIFFELNNTLAKLMKGLPQYKVSIEEIHHTQKLDAPSGTAISLANDIISQSDYTNWTLEHPKSSELPIVAKRIENVPGTHEITYESVVDSIQIKHTAHSREGFALGAVVAAEWLQHKKGVFTMKDVLNIG
jgi:4-hydroxy-tetrahydrodipicolinate reductase